jgi:predicted esterase
VGDADGYIWNDQDRALEEILLHTSAIRNGYPLISRQFVVGGFSMGGGLAIQLAVSNKLDIGGFLAVAPFIPDVNQLLEQLKAAQPQALRGYIVVGDEDYGCLKIAQALGEQLPAYGVACEVEVHPNTGHWFPPDFAQSLQRGLAFITRT